MGEFFNTWRSYWLEHFFKPTLFSDEKLWTPSLSRPSELQPEFCRSLELPPGGRNGDVNNTKNRGHRVGWISYKVKKRENDWRICFVYTSFYWNKLLVCFFCCMFWLENWNYLVVILSETAQTLPAWAAKVQADSERIQNSRPSSRIV